MSIASDLANELAGLKTRMIDMEIELQELRKDKARLDWLADVNNLIGNVQLPHECVKANLDNMRAAIDAAMELEGL